MCRAILCAIVRVFRAQCRHSLLKK